MKAKATIDGVIDVGKGGQLVNDRLFVSPFPEDFNFLTEWGICRTKETDRVGMVELKWGRFSVGFPCQVE